MEMLNVLPINDIQHHREDDHCMCNPVLEIVNNVQIVKHNSFDGREFDEFLKG